MSGESNLKHGKMRSHTSNNDNARRRTPSKVAVEAEQAEGQRIETPSKVAVTESTIGSSVDKEVNTLLTVENSQKNIQNAPENEKSNPVLSSFASNNLEEQGKAIDSYTLSPFSDVVGDVEEQKRNPNYRMVNYPDEELGRALSTEENNAVQIGYYASLIENPDQCMSSELIATKEGLDVDLVSSWPVNARCFYQAKGSDFNKVPNAARAVIDNPHLSPNQIEWMVNFEERAKNINFLENQNTSIFSEVPPIFTLEEPSSRATNWRQDYDWNYKNIFVDSLSAGWVTLKRNLQGHDLVNSMKRLNEATEQRDNGSLFITPPERNLGTLFAISHPMALVNPPKKLATEEESTELIAALHSKAEDIGKTIAQFNRDLDLVLTPEYKDDFLGALIAGASSIVTEKGPGLALSALAWWVTGSAEAGGVVSAAEAYYTNYTLGMLVALERRGVNTKDKTQIIAALSDRETLMAVEKTAVRYGDVAMFLGALGPRLKTEIFSVHELEPSSFFQKTFDYILDFGVGEAGGKITELINNVMNGKEEAPKTEDIDDFLNALETLNDPRYDEIRLLLSNYKKNDAPVQTARQRAKYFTELHEQLTQANWDKMGGEASRLFVEEIADSSAIQTVLIPTKMLMDERVINALKNNPSPFLEEGLPPSLTNLQNSFSESVNHWTRVPFKEYLLYYAPTEAGKILAEHIKTNPSDITLAQAESDMAQGERMNAMGMARVQEKLDEQNQKMSSRSDFDSYTLPVLMRFRSVKPLGNMDARMFEATGVGSYWETRLSQYGVKPDEINAWYPLDVRGGDSIESNLMRLSTAAKEKNGTSAFVQESSRHFFAMELSTAKGKEGVAASKPIAQDWNVMLQWMGVDGIAAFDKLTRPEQEKIMDLYGSITEVYLIGGEYPDGMQPPLEVLRVLRAHKGWLMNFYDTVPTGRFKFSENVNIFLQKLKSAEMQVIYLFDKQGVFRYKNAEEVGMTEEEFVQYNQLYESAQNNAKEELSRLSLSDLQYREGDFGRYINSIKSENGIDDIHSMLISDGRIKINESSDYRLWKVLSSAQEEDKISLDAINDLNKDGSLIDSETLKALIAYGLVSRTGGGHPDDIAKRNGIGSGVELINMLKKAPRPNEQAEYMARKALFDNYAEIKTNADFAIAAQSAFYNDAFFDMQKLEYTILARQASVVEMSNDVMKERALDLMMKNGWDQDAAHFYDSNYRQERLNAQEAVTLMQELSVEEKFQTYNRSGETFVRLANLKAQYPWLKAIEEDYLEIGVLKKQCALLAVKHLENALVNGYAAQMSYDELVKIRRNELDKKRSNAVSEYKENQRKLSEDIETMHNSFKGWDSYTVEGVKNMYYPNWMDSIPSI